MGCLCESTSESLCIYMNNISLLGRLSYRNFFITTVFSILLLFLCLSLSLSRSISAGRQGQPRREGESHHHQLVLSLQKYPEEHASIMILSSYLSLLTGTSRSRQRGGCEGREGLPSKRCQSLAMC